MRGLGLVVAAAAVLVSACTGGDVKGSPPTGATNDQAAYAAALVRDRSALTPATLQYDAGLKTTDRGSAIEQVILASGQSPSSPVPSGSARKPFVTGTEVSATLACPRDVTCMAQAQDRQSVLGTTPATWKFEVSAPPGSYDLSLIMTAYEGQTATALDTASYDVRLHVGHTLSGVIHHAEKTSGHLLEWLGFAGVVAIATAVAGLLRRRRKAARHAATG